MVLEFKKMPVSFLTDWHYAWGGLYPAVLKLDQLITLAAMPPMRVSAISAM